MQKNESIFYSDEESPLFSKTGIRFILTSRYGGVSLSPYDSLNLAYHTGDNPDFVSQNRKFITQTFFPTKELLWLDQIHSDNVLQIQNKYYNNGFISQGDALICEDKKFAAMILVADCNPILIYESNAQIFALIHAGRMGVTKSILTKTIQHILKKPQSKIQNLLIFIGPSIRKCCYEISKDLSNSFPQKYILKNGSSHKLDMIAMLQDELLKNNIQPYQTQILPYCTCCQKELFSYRRDGITGRFALIASLK